MECAYGTPKPPRWKPITGGHPLKKGDFIRFEVTGNFTDDRVGETCAIARDALCQPGFIEPNFHLTYLYASNTKIIAEYQVIQDTTLPVGETAYIYVPSILEKYGYIIIPAAIGAIGIIAFTALWRKV